MSYKVAVKVSGEPQWNYNAQRFATKAEADAAGSSIWSSWSLVEKYEAQKSDDPVNYRWEDGKAVAVEAPAPQMEIEAPVASEPVFAYLKSKRGE